MYLVCRDNHKFPETARMIQAAQELGINVSERPYDNSDYFYLYGTRDFVKQHVNHPRHILKGLEHQWDYAFLSSIDGISLLNRYYDICPVYRLPSLLNTQKYAAYDDMFIRPYNGEKSFDGQVFKKESVIKYGLNKLVGHFIPDYELCIITTSKNKKDVLESEYRFFIFDADVIGGQYFPEYKYDTNQHIYNQVTKWAYKIIESGKSIGPYVMDVEVNGGQAMSIIELNSWNSSSFYLIPPHLLLKTIQRNIYNVV